MFVNREHLLDYMLKGHLHLSKKDYSFFSNIKNIIQEDRPITSNQNKLFDKLLVKYQRQLKKLNHDIDDLITLPWKFKVLESKQEYLNAYISIEDDRIIIKSPFNNKFIQMFRRIHCNKFVWNKAKKIYEAPVSTYQLKIAIDSVSECYGSVLFCDTIKDLLIGLDEFKQARYWNPTLVKRNNIFFIAATNSSLMESLKDVVLNDDPKTLMMLSLYGISFDDSVINNDPVKYFACNRELSLDLENLDEIIQNLKLLEINHVFTSRVILNSNNVFNEIQTKLSLAGITCNSIRSNTEFNNAVLFTTSSGAVSSSKVIKTIYLTNSRPVLVK